MRVFIKSIYFKVLLLFWCFYIVCMLLAIDSENEFLILVSIVPFVISGFFHQHGIPFMLTNALVFFLPLR